MKTFRDIPRLSGERIDGHASDLRCERGDVTRLRSFHRPIVGISSPELIRQG